MKGYADRLTKEEYDLWLFSLLYNALVLFSLDYNSLIKMTGPLFSPIGELDSCYDYAFKTMLEKILETDRIKKSGVFPLIKKFEKQVDELDPDDWEYEALEKSDKWQSLRIEADRILSELGEVSDRVFEKRLDGLPTSKELDAREKQ
jgi:hypothetical protein